MNLHVIWRCWFLFFEKKRWALFVILRQLWLWTVLAPWLMSFQRQTWRLIESRAMIDSISEANMALGQSTRHDWCYFRGKHGAWPIYAPWLIQFQRQTWHLANPRAMIDSISEENMAPGQSTRHDWSNFRVKHGAWPIQTPWLIQFQRQTWRLS